MLELAYIAGLFDGEGSIVIVKSKPKRDCKSTQYKLEIAIVNTCLEPLTKCQQQFGGSVGVKPQTLRRYKTCYYWGLSYQKARKFLEVILPYLIIKKRQAELALEFMARKTYKPSGVSLSEAELALRHSYYLRMKELNR